MREKQRQNNLALNLTGYNSIVNTGRKIYNDPLKFASDLGTTALDISQLGQEAAMTTGSYLTGDKKNYFDVDTDALGTSLDAAFLIPGSQFLKTGKNVIKPLYTGLKKYGKDLVQTSKQAGKFQFPKYKNVYSELAKNKSITSLKLLLGSIIKSAPNGLLIPLGTNLILFMNCGKVSFNNTSSSVLIA